MEDDLIPGTQRLELGSSGIVVLCPTPSSDPNQPLNWSTARKSLHLGLLSLYTIFVFGTLCCGTPIWANLNTELGISYDNLNYGYAACQAAMAIGCVLFVPLALRYGRRPVYIVTSMMMLASAIWLAKMQTMREYFGVSILYGLAGCVNEALFQITISDLFFVHQRGTVTGIYVVNLIIGNYLSPVAGGYIGNGQGWRWVYWWCTIFLGVTTLLLIFFLEESKFTWPGLDGQVFNLPLKTQEINNAKEDKELHIKPELSAADMAKELPAAEPESNTEPTPIYTRETRREDRIDMSIPPKTYWQRHAFITTSPNTMSFREHMVRHITRPFLIVATFPAVAFASLQYGWTMTLLVICATTQAVFLPYPPYNFSSIGVGNMSLPPAIGAILGSIFGGPIVDYTIVKVARWRNGIYEPETRLWLFLIPGVTGAAGMWLYGLTIAKGMHWIINAVGAGLMGFAIGGCSDMAVTYMQDSYQEILGDALVASVFIRNALATAFIFAVPAWEAASGAYNMFIVMGVLTLVIFSSCLPMITWGRSLRARLADKYMQYVIKQM